MLSFSSKASGRILVVAAAATALSVALTSSWRKSRAMPGSGAHKKLLDGR
jgi:hypothetical protein